MKISCHESQIELEESKIQTHTHVLIEAIESVRNQIIGMWQDTWILHGSEAKA